MAVSAAIAFDVPINNQQQLDCFEDCLEPITLRRRQGPLPSFGFWRKPPKFDVNQVL
jgi:hypothetical protein